MQHRAKEIGRRRCVPTLHRHDIERKPVLLGTESEVAYLQAIEEMITRDQPAQQP